MRLSNGAYTYNQLESILRKTLLALIIILAVLIAHGGTHLVGILSPQIVPVDMPSGQEGAVIPGGDSDDSEPAVTYPIEEPPGEEEGYLEPIEPPIEVRVPVEITAPVLKLPKDWGVILRSAPAAGKKIALTFDDGPHPFFTNAYLKILAEHEVPATFFVIGKQLEEHPQLAKEILEGGHELGGHSYRHQRLTTLTNQEILEDFRLVDQAFLNTTGQKPLYYRPPYGAYDVNIISIGKKTEQLMVMWSIDPRDWESETHHEITQRVLDRASDGAIIVLHEGKKTTLEALPHIITSLKTRGYQFVTISQMLEHVNNNLEQSQ